MTMSADRFCQAAAVGDEYTGKRSSQQRSASARRVFFYVGATVLQQIPRFSFVSAHFRAACSSAYLPLFHVISAAHSLAIEPLGQLRGSPFHSIADYVKRIGALSRCCAVAVLRHSGASTVPTAAADASERQR